MPLRFLIEFQNYCRSAWEDKEDLLQSTRSEMRELLPIVSSLLREARPHKANDEQQCQRFLQCSVEALEAELWLEENGEAQAEILDVEPEQIDVQNPIVAPIWLGFAAVMRPEWEQDWQTLVRVCGWEDT